MTVQTTSNTLPFGDEGSYILKWANELCETPFYKKLGRGGTLAIMLTAREIGMPVMSALNGGLYNVDGKIAMSAQTMQMLIEMKGHWIEILQSDEQICKLRFHIAGRANAADWSFTIDHAKQAGLLGKDNWRKYPRDMLYNRCMASGIRKICPSAISGLYLKEELEKADAEWVDTPTKSAVTTPAPKIEAEHVQDFNRRESEEQLQKFIEKYSIKDPESPYRKCIEFVAKDQDMNLEKVIEAASKKEIAFVTKYNSWKKENQGDEVFEGGTQENQNPEKNED